MHNVDGSVRRVKQMLNGGQLYEVLKSAKLLLLLLLMLMLGAGVN